MALITKQIVPSQKKLLNASVKKSYYAFLLDNIGPFPKEITLSLPEKVFAAIWTEYYHYLSLVAETARSGGGVLFIQYVEFHAKKPGLPNLSKITDYLVFENLSAYPNQKGLNYWLNISALLEYGCLIDDLSEIEKNQCRRFEYLQELDHFSEIMDLSLLTKHIRRAFNNLINTEKSIFLEKYSVLLQKYLGLRQAIISDENYYKPIAGRSKYINLGLERMLGEAIAKRRNCHYVLYSTTNGELGEYNQNYYPIKTTGKTEAQFKVLDLANIGLIRANYPYLSLLLTANAKLPILQKKIKAFALICSSLILHYGMEMGIAMFDGYIFDNGFSKYRLSLLTAQIFKPKEKLPLQVKIISIGSGAGFIIQNQKIQHIHVHGAEKAKDYLGQSGAKQQRNIILLPTKHPIKIILAPSEYGNAFQCMNFKALLQSASQNIKNIPAWLMTTFIKPFSIPKSTRNILVSHIKPDTMEIIERPKWSQEKIKEIPEFFSLIKQYQEYFKHYRSVEVNMLYAHVHADRVVDIHQKISIDIAHALKYAVSEKSISFTLHPLIDNLHVRDVFDYKKYLELLTEKNMKPQLILTEDSLLLDRIGQGILHYFIHKKTENKNQIIFEGNRAINVVFPDNTIVQLIDHMDKEGRLSCVTFDLAQIYYRQDPDLFERIFRKDILVNYPNSILAKWFIENPLKNYHEIMYDMVYTHTDIQYRNQLFQKITKEIRPNLNKIENTSVHRHYVDALQSKLTLRNQTRTKKVISVYILEGSYDAQFDRYAKVHRAFALPDIHTYRVTFTSEVLGLNVMCIQS